MKQGKIHILHIFSSFDVGGTETRTCQIINRLGNHFRHTILVENSECLEAVQLLNADVDFSIIALEEEYTSYFQKIQCFRQQLKKTAADLVISYCWGTSDWVIANGFFKITPHIHNEEGFFDETPDRQLFRRLMVRRLFFNRVDCLLVPSMFLQDLARKSWKMPDQKISYLPNGLDVEGYEIQTEQSVDEIILVIVASIHPIKNHIRLLSAFQKLQKKHPVKLWIIGDGQDRDKVEKFVHENSLADRVELFGFQGRPDHFLQKAHIFCLSSDSEQMPMTVLEAMATGLPVVATDVGDIRHMVCEENKPYIVSCDDPQAYENRLEQLILDPDTRKRIGTKNREKCEAKYSSRIMVERHRQLYRATIKNK